MRASRRIILMTIAMLLASSLGTSLNLVLCFSDSHTAVEVVHSPEKAPVGLPKTIVALNGSSETCLDVPFARPVDLQLVVQAQVTEPKPFYSEALKSDINSVCHTIATDLIASRSLDDFLSSIRLMI